MNGDRLPVPVASKKGLLEKAHLGTCFLDEVADLSPVLQGKLLRADTGT